MDKGAAQQVGQLLGAGGLPFCLAMMARTRLPAPYRCGALAPWLLAQVSQLVTQLDKMDEPVIGAAYRAVWENRGILPGPFVDRSYSERLLQQLGDRLAPAVPSCREGEKRAVRGVDGGVTVLALCFGDQRDQLRMLLPKVPFAHRDDLWDKAHLFVAWQLDEPGRQWRRRLGKTLGELEANHKETHGTSD